jgi:hypothetical protein
MTGKLFRVVLTVVVLAMFATTSFGQLPTPTQSSSWGHIKSLYRTSDSVQAAPMDAQSQTLARLQKAQTPEEAQQIIESAPTKVREQFMTQAGEMVTPQSTPPAWTHPIAGEAMRKFSLASSDILAVQRVVALDNGMPIDSADVVVTEKQWYYSSLTTGELTSQPPGEFALTTEMDIYGSGVELVAWSQECWNIHWAVTFYMPVCFYELWPGRFDGIVDAWAPRPNCSPWCNGGLCALYMCGDAWDGAGNLQWWNFHQSCSDSRASKKVGKIVQKRWLHTWQLCHHRSDADIARSVRTRIRY